MARGVQNDPKTGEGEQQNDKNPEMARFKTFQRPQEPHQPNQRRHDNHRIHARPLPVAAAQMQPHAEFVKGKAQGNPVHQCDDIGGASTGRRNTRSLATAASRKIP